MATVRSDIDSESEYIVLCCQKLCEYLSITRAKVKKIHNIDEKDYNLKLKVTMRISISKILEYLAPKTSVASIISDIVKISDGIVVNSGNKSRMGVITREAMRFLMAVLFDADITLGKKFLVDRKKIDLIVECAELSADVREHLLALTDDIREFAEVASTDLEEVEIAL